MYMHPTGLFARRPLANTVTGSQLFRTHLSVPGPEPQPSDPTIGTVLGSLLGNEICLQYSNIGSRVFIFS